MAEPLSSIDYIAGRTVIRFTDQDPALLDVDAVVEEQDTNLLLGKSPVILNSVESFPDLVRRMESQASHTPGQVILRRSRPLRLIAIVYDVDQDPICKPVWVETAITRILLQCQGRGVTRLAMPLLGTAHGRLDGKAMLRILQDLLVEHRPSYPRQIQIYKL